MIFFKIYLNYLDILLLILKEITGYFGLPLANPDN